MKSVLVTEFAMLHHFDPVRVILLVLLRNIVAMLALGAGQCNLYSHIGTSWFFSFSAQDGIYFRSFASLVQGKKINPHEVLTL